MMGNERVISVSAGVHTGVKMVRIWRAKISKKEENVIVIAITCDKCAISVRKEWTLCFLPLNKK